MLSRKTQGSLLDRGYSRRQISRLLMGTAAAVPMFNELAQAQQAAGRMTRRGAGGMRAAFDPSIVRITSNENPMGPSKEGSRPWRRWGR